MTAEEAAQFATYVAWAYVAEDMTLQQIADETGRSVDSVRKSLLDMDVPIRSQRSKPRRTDLSMGTHPHLARELLERGRRARDARRAAARPAKGTTHEGRGDAGRVPAQIAAHQAWQTHVANGNALRGIVTEHGWPGRTLVGDQGCAAALQIALHSHHAPGLQRILLHALELAAGAGEATDAQVAQLRDRYLVNTGQPQLYGTAMRVKLDGRRETYPISDSAGLTERRLGVGLPPLPDQAPLYRA